jgi:Arc/MetJ-type ribon-helix-helix transcriptional regulator
MVNSDPNTGLQNNPVGRWGFGMTVALARDVEAFLEDQVRAGVCADASELVNDVLRSLREQQQKPFETTPELEAWLPAAADKPVSPLTHADFDSIRRRACNLPRRLNETPGTP